MACEIAYSSGKNGLKISELLVKRLEGSLQYLDGLFAAIFKHVSPAAFSRYLSAQLPDHISIAEIKISAGYRWEPPRRLHADSSFYTEYRQHYRDSFHICFCATIKRRTCRLRIGVKEDDETAIISRVPAPSVPHMTFAALPNTRKRCTHAGLTRGEATREDSFHHTGINPG